MQTVNKMTEYNGGMVSRRSEARDSFRIIRRRYSRQVVSAWERSILELGMEAGYAKWTIAKWLQRSPQTLYRLDKPR